MRPFFLLLACLYLSLNLPAQDLLDDYYPPSAVPDRIILTLTDTPATSIGVNWRTTRRIYQSYAQVAKADASPYFRDSVILYEGTPLSMLSDRNGANYHSLVLDGLEPNTRYAYRVGDNVHWSEWAHFTTASETNEPLSFIYFGDAQNDIKSMWSRVIRGAYSKLPKADFLLHAGDLVNRADSDQEWGEWFLAGGWIYQMMPSIATPGNHEYRKGSNGNRVLSRHWQPTFTFPLNGPPELPETVYYVDYQGVRIISLDTQAFLSYSRAKSAQIEWLQNVLMNNPNKWTIVTMHHPVFSSSFGRDNKKMRQALKPIFETFGVDLVLQGHDHSYSRGSNLPLGDGVRPVEGPIYVVSVSGPKMYPLGLEDWMQRGGAGVQLYQLIHIDGDYLKFEAYTAMDELYDAFELRKQYDGRNIFFDLAPEEMPEALDIPKSYINRISNEKKEIYQNRLDAYKARKSQLSKKE